MENRVQEEQFMRGENAPDLLIPQHFVITPYHP